LNRVVPRYRDDGNCARRLPGGQRGSRPDGHDDINLEPDQLGGDVGQAAVVLYGRSVFEDDVLAFDPAPLAEALAERFQERRLIGRAYPQEPNSRRLRLLRLHRDGRGEQR
jgi:hypothetical protein